MRKTLICALVLLLVLLTGCGSGAEGPILPSREIVLPTVDPRLAQSSEVPPTEPPQADSTLPAPDLVTEPAPQTTLPSVDPTEPEASAGSPQPRETEPQPTQTRPSSPDQIGLDPSLPPIDLEITPDGSRPTDPPASEPAPTEPAPTRPNPTEPPVTSPTTGTPDNGEASTTDKLQILYVGPYSGPYYEDGSGDEVSSVASMLLKNISEEHLQYAELCLRIGEKEAVFQISDLPAGETVMALEINRLEIRPEQDVTLLQDKLTQTFVEQTDYSFLDFRSDGGNLIVTNNSKAALNSVDVSYKLIMDKQTLLGGVAFHVRFGKLAPGESRTVAAGHYDPETCAIVFVKVT